MPENIAAQHMDEEARKLLARAVALEKSAEKVISPDMKAKLLSDAAQYRQQSKHATEEARRLSR
jgi:hypothetical protein